MRPRRRVQLLYWVPVALLFVLGYAMDRRATARRASAAEYLASSLSDRIDALSNRVDILASMQTRGAVVGPVAEGNEPRRGESVEGYPTTPVCPPPRVLGSGRTGPWTYTDVRLSDGAVRRYYVRTNATPQQLFSVLSNIRADAVDSVGRLRQSGD